MLLWDKSLKKQVTENLKMKQLFNLNIERKQYFSDKEISDMKKKFKKFSWIMAFQTKEMKVEIY